jgi:hypothetical protein
MIVQIVKSLVAEYICIGLGRRIKSTGVIVALNLIISPRELVISDKIWVISPQSFIL